LGEGKRILDVLRGKFDLVGFRRQRPADTNYLHSMLRKRS